MSFTHYGIGLVGDSPQTRAVEQLAIQLGIPSVWIKGDGQISLPLYALSSGADRSRVPSESSVIDFDAGNLFSYAKRVRHSIGIGDATVRCSPNHAAASFTSFRTLVKKCLESINLPLLILSRFPDGKDSVFCVRVDADWYNHNEWRKTREALSPIGNASSWFITCSGVPDEGWNLVRALKEQGIEIGSHGYYHYTFCDRKNNEVNIARAHAALQEQGVEPSSFVAPSAKWNSKLQSCIDSQEYLYSSEFCLAYDTFPFHALVHGRSATALQIPVHPVAPSSFLRNGIEDQNVINSYFESVTNELLSSGLPVLLYGHPADLSKFDGLHALCEKMASRNVSLCSLGAYAEWWRKREEYLHVPWEIAQGEVVPPSVDSSISIIKDDAKDISSPAWKRIKENYPLRYKIGTWLDYEKIVPASRYCVSTLKTLVNYLVKRVRA